MRHFFCLQIGPTLSGNRLPVPTSRAASLYIRLNKIQGRRFSPHLLRQEEYTANPTVYQQNVQINTPLTTDASGNIYFGFLIGPTPIGLQSGLARIAANGTGAWISAASIGGNAAVTNIAMSCAPALSHDGNTLYIATTMQTPDMDIWLRSIALPLLCVNRVRLKDPSSNQSAFIFDASTAAPTIGPDGDVYFGVLKIPSRTTTISGWLLHFNSDSHRKKFRENSRSKRYRHPL